VSSHCCGCETAAFEKGERRSKEHKIKELGKYNGTAGR
jgi:hypothetical protein